MIDIRFFTSTFDQLSANPESAHNHDCHKYLSKSVGKTTDKNTNSSFQDSYRQIDAENRLPQSSVALFYQDTSDGAEHVCGMNPGSAEPERPAGLKPSARMARCWIPRPAQRRIERNQPIE